MPVLVDGVAGRAAFGLGQKLGIADLSVERFDFRPALGEGGGLVVVQIAGLGFGFALDRNERVHLGGALLLEGVKVH
ncbi:MAG: hypothetical protein DCE92_08745 [Alphaproteobacteria bacterium]|nr:MAG: hypothetical protein DCE92_08745 [Alphaproteobacteria bacterium]